MNQMLLIGRRPCTEGETRGVRLQHPIVPDPDKNPSAYMAANYSHPEWLIKRSLTRYGKEKTIEICKINNLPPKVFLRTNHRKISPQEFILLLEKNGINSYAIDNAVVVDSIAVSEIPGFRKVYSLCKRIFLP